MNICADIGWNQQRAKWFAINIRHVNLNIQTSLGPLTLNILCTMSQHFEPTAPVDLESRNPNQKPTSAFNKPDTSGVNYALEIFQSSLNLLAHILIGATVGIAYLFSFRSLPLGATPLHVALCVTGVRSRSRSFSKILKYRQMRKNCVRVAYPDNWVKAAILIVTVVVQQLRSIVLFRSIITRCYHVKKRLWKSMFFITSLRSSSYFCVKICKYHHH